MGVHSGEYGVLENISNVRSWDISEETQPEVIRNSATKGAAARIDGVARWAGNWEAEGGIPYKMPGEVITDFRGYTAPDDNVYGSDGNIAKGNVIIQSVAITLNWGGSESVRHSTVFQGTSPLTFEEGFFEDPGPLVIGKICDVKIDYGASGSEVLLENIEQAVLTFTRENQAYINSSTNCVEAYIPGPIDWSLAITLQDNRRPIPLQTDERFRVWINETQFYILEFGHVEAYNTLNVNPSTGEIITQEMSVMMQAIRQSDGQTGQIVIPGGDIYWPPATPTVALSVKGKNDPPALKNKKE